MLIIMFIKIKTKKYSQYNYVQILTLLTQ